MRHWVKLLALGLPLFAVGLAGPAQAQQAPAAGPPHAWAFGIWTGGLFPVGDPDPATCIANATVIILRDVVLRASVLDIAYRQRLIETVGPTGNGGLQFRLVPSPPIGGAFGGRVAPDSGFGCDGDSDLLTIERRGPNEIVLPNCREFLSPLKRCGAVQ